MAAEGSAGTVETDVRNLERKADGSHPDSPGKKSPFAENLAPERMDEEKQEEEGDKDVKDMFKSMMKMMRNVTTEVACVKSEVGDMKTAVAQANASTGSRRDRAENRG